MSQIPRLYVAEQAIDAHAVIQLNAQQSHYLVRVLRLGEGATVKLLGQAGEWLVRIKVADKKSTQLAIETQLRGFQPSPDIWLLFAPVKNDKIDFLARRAVELGVSALWPIKTQYTQNTRINTERLQANMIEAVEQCSRMDVPELKHYVTFEQALANWDVERLLFHADESGNAKPLHETLQGLKKGVKAAILIGPEGGFSDDERQLLASKACVTAGTLGPRILRAETAALVGLAHLVAWIGDGDKQPHFIRE